MFNGLASRGRECVFCLDGFGSVGFAGVFRPISKAVDGEFSLSELSLYRASVLGRTRTGDPKVLGLHEDSMADDCFAVSDSALAAFSVPGCGGGSFAGIRIFTGDRALCECNPASSGTLLAVSSRPLNTVVFAFVLVLFGVFQCGLIRQSGSKPSFFARALVMRRGGEAMRISIDQGGRLLSLSAIFLVISGLTLRISSV